MSKKGLLMKKIKKILTASILSALLAVTMAVGVGAEEVSPDIESVVGSGEVAPGDSVPGDCSGDIKDNVNTGIVTIIPVALAAGTAGVIGIITAKKKR